MDDQKSLLKKIAYNYGLMLAGLSVLVLAVMYALGLDKSWTISIVSIIATVLIFVYGILAFKKGNGNEISLGQALKVGLAIAAIGGVVAAIYAYIHYSFIYPEFVDMTRQNSLDEALSKNPDLKGEALEMTEKMITIFTSPFVLATFSLIGNLFFGFIISIITGAIVKNNRPK